MAENYTPPPRGLPQIDCYRGCLLGGAIGDALGAPVEFMSRSEILEEFGTAGITGYSPAYGRRGAVTDDTQMTLFTAEGLLRGHVRTRMHGTIPAYTSTTAHALQRWLITQGESPPAHLQVGEDGWLFGHRELHHQRAPGMTCLSALRRMPDFDTPAENDSKGCGGVMRVAPVGMFASSARAQSTDEQFAAEVFRLGVESAALTHGHISGQIPAGFLSLAIALVLRGSRLEDAVGAALDVLRQHRGHEETAELLVRAVTLASTQPRDPRALAALGEGWVAEEALAIAVYCALGAASFEEGVLLAVNHGGDSDSTGAITGYLLGSALGLAAIPARLLDDLELREVIQAVADDLATADCWHLDDYARSLETEYYWSKYPGWSGGDDDPRRGQRRRRHPDDRSPRGRAPPHGPHLRSGARGRGLG